MNLFWRTVRLARKRGVAERKLLEALARIDELIARSEQVVERLAHERSQPQKLSAPPESLLYELHALGADINRAATCALRRYRTLKRLDEKQRKMRETRR